MRVDRQFEWLSTGEAASLLGIATRMLYRFIDEGLLQAYRFGRVIRRSCSFAARSPVTKREGE